MAKKILVTYATRTGTTQGVAEAVGRTLAEGGALVDILYIHEVRDLAPYDAVVVGSAIQDRQWLPEAVRFVRENRETLVRKPFATFTVCMTLAMKNGAQYRPAVEVWVQPVHALVKPVGAGYFAGALDIRKIPGFGNRLKFHISVLFGVWKEGDHRDWTAIRAWAEDLRPRLFA